MALVSTKALRVKHKGVLSIDSHTPVLGCLESQFSIIKYQVQVLLKALHVL